MLVWNQGHVTKRWSKIATTLHLKPHRPPTSSIVERQNVPIKIYWLVTEIKCDKSRSFFSGEGTINVIFLRWTDNLGLLRNTYSMRQAVQLQWTRWYDNVWSAYFSDGSKQEIFWEYHRQFNYNWNSSLWHVYVNSVKLGNPSPAIFNRFLSIKTCNHINVWTKCVLGYIFIFYDLEMLLYDAYMKKSWKV